MVFVPEQAAVQEFAAAGLHPSLHDGVHAWHSDAGEYGLDANVGGHDPAAGTLTFGRSYALDSRSMRAFMPHVKPD
jgi:hypothetical protein